MKRVRWVILMAGALAATGAANARTVTVTQTLDYTSNTALATYFWPPTTIVDHEPFQRDGWKDWGWTHSMRTLAPSGATGIASASLSILAWGVDADYDPPEVDVITVNNTRAGTLDGVGNGVPVPPLPAETYQVTGMPTGWDTEWSMTVFTLNTATRAELLANKELDVFVDIDSLLDPEAGHRVTIRSSTLTVNYTVPGDDTTPVDPNVSMYRFWSPTLSGHFYTISETERDNLIANYPGVWNYEGVAYLAFGAPLEAALKPVYRFWSPIHSTHFYTISETEKTWLVANHSYTWTLEGVAFYAYPEGSQPAGASPVYRFWSGSLGKHFYTISEAEKQNIVNQYSYVWNLEGVAWYAYPAVE